MTTEQPVYGGEAHSGRAARPLGQAVWRGICCRCPRCGEGALYRSFVKTVDTCQVCGEAIHHHRADDFPAYLVLFIVGHIMVGGFLVVENLVALSSWQHLAIWVPLTIALSIALMRPIKGSVVGLQWALYMHGFGGEEEVVEAHPEL